MTHLLQIFSRYVLNSPFGWTLELCRILWVWIVFFCCAFLVQEKDYANVVVKTIRYFPIKIDINSINSIKTKVAQRPSLEKVKDYATMFGRAGGITSTVYIILVGDWSDAIGMFIGVIVTPIVGLIGAVGGSAGGALLATILHYIEFSNFDKEYKLSDDSWKIQIQT